MEVEREIRNRMATLILKGRLAKGWSQKVLAEKVGVSQSAITQFESGHKAPSYDTLFRISSLLKIPIESYFPGTVADSLFRHTIFGQLWLRISYWWYTRKRNKSDESESQ